MFYIDFFRGLQQRLQPRSYLEIGVRWGDSLSASAVPSIGVDPRPDLRVDLPASTEVFSETSDDFFRNPTERLSRFPGGKIHLAFIDGMHLYEFALRDFVNVERHALPGSVVLFDDMLPRFSTEASRRRKTVEWTGDVWKVLFTLRERRPDLSLLQVATEPTGMLIALALDPENGGLPIGGGAASLPHRSPRRVPRAVIDRVDAVDPVELLEAPFWDLLGERWESVTAEQVRTAVAKWQPRPLSPEQVQRSKSSPYPRRRMPGPARRAYRRMRTRLAR